jgi:hypothetical protein
MFNSLIRAIFICFFLLLCVYPFRETITLTFYDDSRILSIFTISVNLIFFTYWVISKPAENSNIKIQKPLFFLMIFCTLGLIITTIFSPSGNSYFHSLNVMIFIIFALSLNFKNNEIRLLIFFIFLLSTILITRCYFYLIFSAIYGYSGDPLILTDKFDNIRFFNQLQIFSLICSLAAIRLSFFKKLAYYNIFSQLLFLFLTGGRGATLSWLVMISVIYISRETRSLAIFAIKLTIIAFLSYLLVNYMLTLNSGGAYLIRFSSSYRYEMWLEALSQLSWQNIFYGYGGGNYYLHTTLTGMMHPHNLVLQLLSEWGLIFTIGFFGLVFIAIKNNLPLLFSKEPNYYAFILVGFIGALVNAQFDGTFHNPVGQLLSFTFLGLLLNNSAYSVSSPQSYWTISLSLPTRIFLASTLLLIVFIYLWLCWLYFQQMQSNPSPSYAGPYFWLSRDPFKLW